MLERLLEHPKHLFKAAIEGQVQERYRAYIQERRFKPLARLMRISGIQPAEGIVEEGYRLNFGKTWVERYIRKTWIDYAVELAKTTGVNPSEETAQEKYLELAQKGSFGDIEKLKQATRIVPRLPEELIQRLYRERLDSFYLVDHWERMWKLTGIMPSEPTVHAAYDVHVSKGWEHNVWRMRMFAKINPAEDLIQARYVHYAKRGAIKMLKELRDATGIQPNLPEELVRAAYSKYADQGKLDRIRQLAEITKIKPGESIIARVTQLLS